ncbi:TonB-dependent receptor [Bordetella genomosp. 10]|nr:TonB-dependent siderophore receptor [Bordetella genomosp. 10]
MTAAQAQTTEEQFDRRNTVVMPAVSVTGEAALNELPGTYAGGQVARGARLGILGNLDVMDTPFNVTSYTSELIENQQARTLADVLANDPSVRFTTSSGHAYENFRIRGFDVNQNDLALNGMYGLLPVGHTPLEMFERVEVLKGPNALFSGMAPSGAVGGTINLVPKRAGEDPLSRVSVGYQSDSQFGTRFDLARRFGAGKSLGLRINGAFSDGDTDLDGQSKKREFLSAAFDYRAGGLTASIDTYYSKESYRGGTPAMFWMATTDIPHAPDPSVNQFPAARGELESKAIVGRAGYVFNSHVSAFAGIGVRDHDYKGFVNGSHVRSINANGDSSNSVTTAQRGYEDNVSAEAGLRFNFDTAGVRHDVVLQASRLDSDSGSASATSSFRTNIYDPVYHAMPAVPGHAPKTAENTLSSLALVDTMSFLDDKLRLTLGARHQRVETRNYGATGAVTSSYDKSALTPAVGIVIKPWGPDISLYANYVQGLSKGDSVSMPTYAFNRTFSPYKTEQKEIGVKWDAGVVTNTLSLFEITKPTLIMTNGNEPSDGGEKRMRGIEWNSFGELSRGIRVLGGATYTQGVQTKTANGAYDGNRAVGAPRWQANLGVEWDPIWVPGVTLSSRITANSSQYLDVANTQKIPGWATLDLGARYAAKLFGRNTVLRLNVDNVFDRHYYSGSFSDTTPIATLGLGRTVMASVTVDF